MDDKKFIISRKELLVRELGVLLAGYVLMCAFLNMNGCFDVLGLYSKIGMVILSTTAVLILLVYSIKIWKLLNKTMKSALVGNILLVTMWNVLIIVSTYTK